MANAEHLAILKEGVERWNEWREENPEVKPDLSGTNLKNVSLYKINLSYADVSFATLCNANLEFADFRSANLQETDFGKANLCNTKMTGATLWDANLSDSDLRNAELSKASFQDAFLLRAQLKNANMNHAFLLDANLSGADLSWANLIGSCLNGANLRESKIVGTDIRGVALGDAIIGHTIFGLLDLSDCSGLDTIEVYAPCIIDFQTLRASRNLPKSFLLKIGLPELYIDYLPDFFQNEGIRYYPVFLSHSWANKPFARKLYEALITKGVNVFFDEKKMKPGDDIFISLSRGIELYDKTILVCSEESLNSWWVDQELELVFEKERNLQKEVGEKIGLLIPITIDDHIFTWKDGKRMAIKRRIIGDFRNWQDDTAFEKALNDLIHALNADRPEVKPVSHLPGKAKP